MKQVFAVVLLLLCLAAVADAQCGRSGTRLGTFRQARHAFHATRHQALADHHAVRHDRVQTRRMLRSGY